MKLSILICSVQKRLQKFAQLAEHLERQALNKPVEILWLGDNKTMTVGEKRNKLLSISKGDYVAFVDDDDWLADDYVELLLQGTESGKDVICFNAEYYNVSTGERMPVSFDMGNLNVNEKGRRLRMPNHLCAVKRTAAIATGFMCANFGEDTNYALRLRNERRINTSHKIDKVLYYYNFDPEKSETWKAFPTPPKEGMAPLYPPDRGKHVGAVLMDVIIVSDVTGGAKKEKECEESKIPLPLSLCFSALEAITQSAINSIAAGNVNIIVLEKAERVKYANADTFLQRSPFNYNQCLNNGALMGNAEYICFTNNDVLFPEGFVENVISIMNGSKDSLPNGHENAVPVHGLFGQGGALEVVSLKNQHGAVNADNISGFCFVMRRDVYHKLGGFKENYPFWCADNVVWEQIKQQGLRHAWLDIKVWHGVSTTLNKLDVAIKEEYTRGCVKQFNRDYNKNVLGMGK